MGKITIVIWTMLVGGSLNWGLVGLFDLNLVAVLFGNMTIVARIVYTLLGLAAAYQVMTVLTAIIRFKMQFRASAKSDNCPQI